MVSRAINPASFYISMFIPNRDHSADPNRPAPRRSHRRHHRHTQHEHPHNHSTPHAAPLTFHACETLPPEVEDPDFGLLIYAITREEVEACDTRRFLAAFSKENVSPARASRLMGNVSFIIHGYDDLDRHLCNIPTVCRYYGAIHRVFPAWLFYSELSTLTLQMIFWCILNDTPIGRAAFNGTAWEAEAYIAELMKFIDAGAEVVYSLCEHAGLEEQVADARMEEIIKYFKQPPLKQSY